MRIRPFFFAIALVSIAGVASRAQSNGEAAEPIAPSNIIDSDPSGAKRFLAEWGEPVTLYGSRRYGPLYEPGRAPPPTDPVSGWPLDGLGGAYTLVGGPAYSPYRFSYSPYGAGYYRSYYRPSYVPYGYGYGWGYRYPFGYSYYANRWSYYRPSYGYGLYQPWSSYPNYGWQPPYVDYGASFLDDGALIASPTDFGGCFYW
jgi:hypothetical protein